MCLFPLGSPQRYQKKIAGILTKNSKYDEQLKKIPMMTRRNNVVMRESNDNIDHKNMVTT